MKGIKTSQTDWKTSDGSVEGWVTDVVQTNIKGAADYSFCFFF